MGIWQLLHLVVEKKTRIRFLFVLSEQSVLGLLEYLSVFLTEDLYLQFEMLRPRMTLTSMLAARITWWNKIIS